MHTYCMPIGPGSSHTLTYCIFIAILSRAIIMPILQMEIMRLREIK